MRLGVLGGTFDPVHNGHLAVAQAVRDRLQLDQIIFVPACLPWLKKDRQVTPPEHRIAMLRLALAERAGLTVSPLEIVRGGPSYTADTVEELRRCLGTEAELFFIMGCDSLAGLPRWQDPARIIKMCRLVAVPRPGCPRTDLTALEAAIPGISGRVVLLDAPVIDVSATDIRRRIAAGLPVDHLVPPPVLRYIREHRLYLDEVNPSAG
ncbi:MAG: nicotinate-nucleotide adenylyltransferase [Chloroflexi bacterium]|nr:nicotinate-nucleotide adenylyltransferase [Chloroflexota bacterium]